MRLLAFAILLFFLSPGVSSAFSDWRYFTDQFVVLPTPRAQAFEKASPEAMDELKKVLSLQIGHLGFLGTGGAQILGIDREVDFSAAQEIADRFSKILGKKVEPDLRVRHAITPNDLLYPQQWHYFELFSGIEVESAWDNFIGGLNIWDNEAGYGSIVAVLDTGYRPHADLAANILPGYDMISNTFSSNDGDGRDPDAEDPGDWALAGDCSPTSREESSSWHGTHVAGTIAAVTNNSTGVAGIAPGAKVLPVRVLGKCGGYSSDIADAIIWAAGLNVIGTPINPRKANVINLSLSGPGSCPTFLQDAIDSAVGEGVTVITAAGNDDAAASGYFPANCKNVITVAAIGRNADRAYYSNFGDVIDIAAPGGDFYANGGILSDMVLSTSNAGARAPSADNYAYLQGTSMATPHVAGTAALMYSINPDVDSRAIEYAIQASAKPFPKYSTCAVGTCGTGIVDAAAAIETIFLPPPYSCDEPAMERNVESGVFLWQVCPGGVPSGHWKVRVLSGGSSSTSVYEGQISSTAGFREGATTFSLEGNDLLEVTQSTITYSLRVINAGWDGFDFTVSPIGTTCFDPISPEQRVFIGENKVLTSTPIDLETLTPCSASPPIACGRPMYDAVSDAGLYLWEENCGDPTRSFEVRVLQGGTSQVVTYEGRVDSDEAFGGTAAFSLESNDLLELLNGDRQIHYQMVVRSPYEDGFSFDIPDLANTCFGVDLPAAILVQVGPDKAPIATPFNLTNFGPCGTMPPPLAGVCGAPAAGPATDAGLFLWEEDCGGATRSYSVRAWRSGQAGVVTYEGLVTSDQALAGVSGISLEPNDVLALLNADQQIDYSMVVRSPYEDGFDFTAPDGASVCFGVDLPAGTQVQVGPSRTLVSAPFRLPDLAACTP